MPIVVWIIALIAAGVASIFTAWQLRQWFMSDRTVAFIGRQGAGKTTLLYVIEHGKVPKEPFPPTTVQVDEEVQVESTTLHIIDSGGDRLSQWLMANKRAGHVVYLFDANLVARQDPDALSAIAADAEQIRDELRRGSDDSRFVLCGTHSDKFESKEDEGTVRRHREVQKLKNACNVGDDQLLIGSLATDKDALALSSSVIKSFGH